MTNMSDRTGGHSRPGATLRVGGALPIATVLDDLGADRGAILREAGIDSSLLADPDNLISYRARDRLMACCVTKTGCTHFGLLVGQRMNLQSLGLVGMLVRNSPDVRTALHNLVRYFHLHTNGAFTHLKITAAAVILAYDFRDANGEATDQTADGALAMMLNILRTFCGRNFVLIEACFRHRNPENANPYRRLFRAPLRFDAQQNAVVFSPRWLDVRLTGADVELQRLLQKQIDELEAKHDDDFAEQLRGVLRSALLGGQGSAGQVAKLFSMHTRTLSRRLEEFGTSFREIADEVRFEIAQQLLRQTSLDVGEIAASLGYARASAFTRAFRRWSGSTPTIWRATRLKAR